MDIDESGGQNIPLSIDDLLFLLVYFCRNFQNTVIFNLNVGFVRFTAGAVHNQAVFNQAIQVSTPSPGHPLSLW